MFVFGVGWAAWDTAAGVATGILVQAADESGSAAFHPGLNFSHASAC